MHNKFVVIDGSITWTGSWNLTDTGTYRNNNNAIRIISKELAENYAHEFEEMFLDGAFGPTSPAATPHRRSTIAGTRVETYFAPEDGAMQRVIEVVSRATESIRLMAFSFTDDALGDAMRERAAAGVLVEGVFDALRAGSQYSEFPRMREAGLSVWRDGNPGIMHHKVIIVDGSTVVTGSFNFTRNANRSNDENLLIITSQEIAGHFQEEFERLVSSARP
jgi:phosphatidylserine/phosphatidylglycerophosphate/cardiolipin synthase-like enzyme